MLATFAAHREMWAASFDMISQADHVPQVRDQLSAGLVEARLSLARLFLDIDPATDPAQAWAVGSFCQALLGGVMLQCSSTPTGRPPRAN